MSTQSPTSGEIEYSHVILRSALGSLSEVFSSEPVKNTSSNAPSSSRVPMHDAANRSVLITRDAVGNTIITGDHNSVVVYQLRSFALEDDATSPAKLSDNPYRGLEAFDENDSARFFGRSREIASLWEKLHDLSTMPPSDRFLGRILPIIGPSGSGKSSLGRAGLIAELVRRPWPGRSPSSVAIVIPGERPLEALAAAMLRTQLQISTDIGDIRRLAEQLGRPDSQGNFDGLRLFCNSSGNLSRSLVLLVDQFEEVFSTCPSAEHRIAFIENLRLAALDSSGSVSVVLTIRSDFLPQTQRIDWLSKALTYNGYIVPKMDEVSLRVAISEPARLAGFTFHQGTVDLLIEQTKGRDGALPLLQFALSQIWQGLTQTPSIAPVDTLRTVGGIGGALAREAQRQFDALSEHDKAIAKRGFISGVQLGEPGKETRRRYGISEIVARGQTRDEVLRVLQRFSNRDARLLTFSTSIQDSEIQVEMTHETLISEWPELADWIAKTREDILFHRRMTEAANNWRMKTASLWRTPELERLRDFHKRAANEFTELESTFFEASERQHRVESLVRRTAVIALVSAVVVTSLLAIWAFHQQHQAQTETTLARAHQLAAESNAAVSLYPQRSLLLAVEAQSLGADTVSPEQALRDALGRIAGRGFGRVASSVKQVLITANKRWLVVKETEGKVSIHSMQSAWDQPRNINFLGYGPEYRDLDFSPDRRWLISAVDEGGYTIWDLQSQGYPGSTEVKGGDVHAFSSDSHWFAASSPDQSQLRLWSLLKMQPTPTVTVPLESAASAIAASNSTMVVALADGAACEINLFNPTPNCRPTPLSGNAPFERIELSANGQILIGAMRTKAAAWKGGHRVVAWFLSPLASPSRSSILLDDVASIDRVAFSHNSQWAAITTNTDLNSGNGGLIHLCKFKNPSARCSLLNEHRGEITSLVFSNDDSVLISTSWDGTTRLWNLDSADPSKAPLILRGHNGWVTVSALDGTGRWLATGGRDQNVILWDLKSRDVASSGSVFRGMEASLSTLSFASDSSQIAAGSDDGGIRVWDLKRTLPSVDPDILAVQLGHADVGTGMTFTPDMRWAFTYEGDDGDNLTLRRVSRDRRGEDPIVIPFKLEHMMLDATFSQDSQWLAVSDMNVNTTKLYSLHTDDPTHHVFDLIGTFPGYSNHKVFSPNHKWLITLDGDHDGATLNLWGLVPSGAPVKHQLTKDNGKHSEPQFSSDGRWLIYSEDGVLHSVDLAASSPESTDRTIGKGIGDFSDVWFTPGNDRVAYISPAKRAIVIAELRGVRDTTVGPAIGGDIRVTISPDRTRLLTSSNPAMTGEKNPMDVLSADTQVKAQLWKWTGKEYAPSSSSITLAGKLSSSEFSPASRWLVTAGEKDTNPSLWDLNSNDPFKNGTELWGHGVKYNHLWHVSFSPDERWLATAGYDDATVRMWNLTKGDVAQAVTLLPGRNTSITDFSFSPNSTLLIAIDQKGPRMWRIGPKGVSDVSVSLGDVVADEESAAENTMFSPDGEELATWGGGRVKFWSLRLPELARKAQIAAGRNFTWNEWARAFPAQEYKKLFAHLPVDASVVSGILERAHLEVLLHHTQNAKRLYEMATGWSSELGDPTVSNDVAWKGVTDNFPASVKLAAEAAVKMEPSFGDYRDTRALIRALTGDNQGAIEDYNSYLQWAVKERHPQWANIQKRRAWLDSLKSGSNPFNDKLLHSLRDE